MDSRPPFVNDRGGGHCIDRVWAGHISRRSAPHWPTLESAASEVCSYPGNPRITRAWSAKWPTMIVVAQALAARVPSGRLSQDRCRMHQGHFRNISQPKRSFSVESFGMARRARRYTCRRGRAKATRLQRWRDKLAATAGGSQVWWELPLPEAKSNSLVRSK